MRFDLFIINASQQQATKVASKRVREELKKWMCALPTQNKCRTAGGARVAALVHCHTRYYERRLRSTHMCRYSTGMQQQPPVMFLDPDVPGAADGHPSAVISR